MFRQTILLALAASAALAAPISPRALQGTATFYAVGLGNCGWQSSSSDFVVAVPTARYGPTSEKSSLCGQTVHITNENTGQSQDAKIVDSCPTCVSSSSLDMSSGLFTALGGTESEGVFPISWTFGSGSSDSSSDSTSSDSNSNSETSSASSESTTTPVEKPAVVLPANTTVIPAITAQPNHTVATVPTWWATIDMSSCNLNPAPPINETVVAIGPSSNTHGHPDLTDACGLWVNVLNPANQKNVTARVAAVYGHQVDNFIVLSTGYTAIADLDEGGLPIPIGNVTWGFVQ